MIPCTLMFKSFKEINNFNQINAALVSFKNVKKSLRILISNHAAAVKYIIFILFYMYSRTVLSIKGYGMSRLSELHLSFFKFRVLFAELENSEMWGSWQKPILQRYTAVNLINEMSSSLVTVYATASVTLLLSVLDDIWQIETNIH